MSRLREARALLAMNGIGRSAYQSETGCYCSVGALHAAYSGHPDSATIDLYRLGAATDEAAIRKRRSEFAADLQRLAVAAGLYVSFTQSALRSHVEDWHDREPESVIMAAWDKAISTLESESA